MKYEDRKWFLKSMEKIINKIYKKLSPYEAYKGVIDAVNGDFVDLTLKGDSTSLTNIINKTGETLSPNDRVWVWAIGGDLGNAIVGKRLEPNITGGGGATGVLSVFSRTGNVVAQSGDYDADQIDDSSTTNKFATQSEKDKITAIPSGGTAGQVLEKVDGTDYNTQWATPSGGGAVTSVFSRTGAVVAQSGDYEASEVTNAFDKTSDTTDDVTEGSTNKYFPEAPTDGNTYGRNNGSWNQIPSGGTIVTFFQVQDSGATGQLTTGTAAVLSGMWGTPTLTNANFSWDGSTGTLTVNADGVIEIDTKACGYQTANNRNELHIQIYKNGTTVLVEDSQYASRNNTQRRGSAYINGYKDTATNGDTYQIRVYDVGVAVTIGDSNLSGQTYISAKHYA